MGQEQKAQQIEKLRKAPAAVIFSGSFQWKVATIKDNNRSNIVELQKLHTMHTVADIRRNWRPCSSCLPWPFLLTNLHATSICCEIQPQQSTFSMNSQEHASLGKKNTKKLHNKSVATPNFFNIYRMLYLTSLVKPWIGINSHLHKKEWICWVSIRFTIPTQKLKIKKLKSTLLWESPKMQSDYSLENQLSLKTLCKQAHQAIRQDAIQLKNANLV